jgi:lactoylglutathione lyase
MKTRIATAFLVLTFCAGAMAEEALYHHMHLTATNSEEGAQWYADHFDGEKNGGVAIFGHTVLAFYQKEAGFPGSSGSAVDHIGFSVPDIEAKMTQLEEAGVKIVKGVRQEKIYKIAWVEDPWGTLIEIIEDSDLLGFHHFHLLSADPDATIKWYQETFGGEITDYKGIGALKTIAYGEDGVRLIINLNREAKEPTIGRSIDHLGWSFADLDAAAEVLKGKGVNFTLDPQPFRDLRIAFIDAPDGVRIELVQPASN